jgi:hypothetical protein
MANSQKISQRFGVAKHIGMSLRVKQTDSRWAVAPVLDECRALGKPGLARLAPNG